MSQPDPYLYTPPPATGRVSVPGPPPKRGRNRGWIIGGVSGGLAVLFAVGATLVATGVVGPISQGPGSDATAHIAKANTDYEFVSDMCSKLDVSALEDLAPLDGEVEKDTEEKSASESTSVCNARFEDSDAMLVGGLYASATIAKTEAAAAEDAKTVRDPNGLDGEMAISDLTGNWDFGNISKKFHPSTGALRVYVLIQDSNFTAIAEATFTRIDGETPEAEVEQAAVATAIGILELSEA